MLLYPDTNIFLHYRRLDEIDWRALVAMVAAAEPTIVVAQVVMRELEQHKHHHHVKRIRRRADEVVSFLYGLLSKGMKSGLPVAVREGVLLDFQRGEPQIDFANAGLVATVNDDRIVASVLALRVEDPISDARIVTADLGLQVKAFQHSIQILELPDDLKIPDEPDPQQREIADLRRQVARYEQAAPEVGIAFADGRNHWKSSLGSAIALDDAARQEALARVRERHPRMAMGDARPASVLRRGAPNLGRIALLIEPTGPSDSEVARYNDQLDKFYEKYLKHLEAMADYRAIVARTIRLTLWIGNSGTAPADDMDVLLHFPPGTVVLDADDFPSEPRPPTPPARPRSRSFLDTLHSSDLAALPEFYTPHVPVLHPLVENISPPTIEEGDSYSARIHVRRLKHNQREALHELRVIFRPDVEVRSFSIAFRIQVGNFPDEISGKLHLVIEEQGKCGD